MPRNRMIKPEFWEDEKLALNVCRDARLLYVGMWNYSDDHGVVKGHPAWLRGQIFSFDKIETEVVQRWLQELVNINCLYPFEQDGEHFFLIPNFLKHQKIDHPSKRRNPAPPEGLIEDSTNTPRTLTFEYNKNLKEKENKKEKDILSGKPDDVPYAEIVADLNSYQNSHYKSGTDSIRKLIRGRWADGYRLPDFQYVHAVKFSNWQGEKIDGLPALRYFRPSTLYNALKFPGYREEKFNHEYIANQFGGRELQNLKNIASWLKKKGGKVEGSGTESPWPTTRKPVARIPERSE